MMTIYRLALLCGLFAVSTAFAAPAWVSDQFEITLRSGPSTGNAIQLMLDSGLRLEVLERDADSGYSRVRTPGGTEGWVLTRYLMNEPSAREQLEKLTSQLTSATSRGSSLDAQMKAVRAEYDSASQQIKTLERDKAAVEKELAEIKRTAANVLAIDTQNKTLMDQLAAAQIRVDTLEQENRQLASQKTRYWFMAGGLVLLVGILLGIWLPRVRWQRRSRYDRF
ncbi:MAG: TIGR04211 family SH3 domain-containing protein [Gammaproteobacteria bacterium]|nr:TIGR04211 family SH3 domain-containing protein [Gammaproteobacteria bacterium]MBU2678213.1 TIGR04211 family SH3 domain-containing protein [Gammaproteobacteria bacterium]NNC56322.1 TIGR04211 family SH3 domain-containing protein [Woeseiaceae bacterium]NNL51948.1 TIGR04211 family SH3 domain-containing protein [Woeseiaceae bacterium]